MELQHQWLDISLYEFSEKFTIHAFYLCASNAPFTRERFYVEPYQNRTDRPRVYTGTDGTVPYRTASGTRTGPPRK